MLIFPFGAVSPCAEGADDGMTSLDPEMAAKQVIRMDTDEDERKTALILHEDKQYYPSAEEGTLKRSQ